MSVDTKQIELSISEEVARRQEMFKDDLAGPIKRAAGKVIKGNITGTGPYNPRPIGSYGSPRARYYRGWVTENYGSSRARRSGEKDTQRMEAHSKLAEALQKKYILEAAARSGYAVNSVNKRAHNMLKLIDKRGERVGREGKEEMYRAALDLSPGAGKDLLSEALSRTRVGKRLASRAGRAARKNAAGKMRYGLQSGFLAEAWYDLRGSPTTSGLNFELLPSDKTTAGTPKALVLTRALQRQAGQWYGLLDTEQLIDALRDEGVIAKQAGKQVGK